MNYERTYLPVDHYGNGSPEITGFFHQGVPRWNPGVDVGDHETTQPDANAPRWQACIYLQVAGAQWRNGAVGQRDELPAQDLRWG